MSDPILAAPSRRRAPRTVLIVGVMLACVALVVVVAVLASGSEGADATTSARMTPSAVIDIMLVVFGLFGLVALGLLVRTLLDGRADSPAEKRHSMLGGMLIVGLFGWLVISHAPPPELPELIEYEFDLSTTTTAPPTEPSENSSGSSLPLTLAAISVAVGIGAVWWSMQRRSAARSLGSDEDDLAQQRRDLVIGLLDTAIAELRSHPDPRAAVIATWARLEDALSTVGVPRLVSDTPVRYLGRVLEAVETSGPAARRLTDAFEQAMFSTHTIDRATQLDAVDALVAVRDELQVLSRARHHESVH